MPTSTRSVSIIVPSLNEEENIAPLVSQIIASAVPFREILFVDDHSTDATRDMVRALVRRLPDQSVRLIEQDCADLGLAGAIMLGARAAQGKIVVVMDADLSHPPERINDLLCCDGRGPESSARANQRFASPVVCRRGRYGDRQPLCKRRIDTRMAPVAADSIASRRGARLSAHGRA